MGQQVVCELDALGRLLSMTETCQQIHAECALLFFSINKSGGHSYAEDEIYEFLDNITEEQRKSITHWWTSSCCMTCVHEMHAPLDRLSGIQSLIIGACDKQQTPRDVHEARIKDLVRQKAGRDVSVIFDYTTRFVQNPFYQEDIDDIEVRAPNDIDIENDNHDNDGDEDDVDNAYEPNEDDYDDSENEEEHEEEHEEDHGGTSSDSDDEAILI